MAFLIFSQKGVEIGRRQLRGAVVIGRAPECDISVHDILLSRRHCRIEPASGRWAAIDLNSKNGTRVGNHRITRQGLRDGDLLVAGKTTIRFQLGKVPGAPATGQPAGKGTVGKRPADPFEALAGTVTDFDPDADAVSVQQFQRRMNLPTPRPVPREPAAYVRDDVYSMLNEIASSSWDSIYASASRPLRPLPEMPPAVAVQTARKIRRPSRPQTPEAAAARSSSRPLVRPARPTPVRKPGWVSAAARSIGRTLQVVRRFVTPTGAVWIL